MTNRRNFLKGMSAVVLTAHQARQAMAHDALSGSVPGAEKKSVMLEPDRTVSV
jgi:hypothetical protein